MDKIKEFLSNKGFSKNQIEKIIHSYIFQTYKDYNKLLNRIQKSYQWLEDQHYDKADIIHMVNDNTSLLFLDSKTLDNKVKFFKDNGFSDDEVKKITKGCSIVFSLSIEENMSKTLEFLDNLYKKETESKKVSIIKRIVLLYPQIFTLSLDSIKDSLKAMKEFGLNNKQLLFAYRRAPSAFRSREAILKKVDEIKGTKIQLDSKNEFIMNFKKSELVTIISKYPRILTYSTTLLNQKLTSLFELGFDPNRIRKMILMSPPLLSLGKERYKKVIENFESLKYSKEDALKILGNMPTLFNLDKSRIDKNIENMEKYGYTNETYRKMTVSHASLLNLTNRRMNSKLKGLEKLGFSKDEIIYMTSVAPNLITSSVEMTKEKIEYLRYIGFGELLKRKPTILITGVATVYARYEFFKNHVPPIKIDETHHSNLFIDWKRFEKRFGITKQDLLKKYDYNLFKENKKKER